MDASVMRVNVLNVLAWALFQKKKKSPAGIVRIVMNFHRMAENDEKPFYEPGARL